MIPSEEIITRVWPPVQKGGQHVTIAAPGVEIEHIPSGIVIRVSCERSQHKNRAVAIAALEGALTCSAYRP